MIAVALKGLAGRKLRATLTALAIVLGVAMISGTYVLTDTIDKAFDSLFVEAYAGTDAVITGKEAFETDFGSRAAFDEALLAEVRRSPTSRRPSAASPTSPSSTDKQGDLISTQGAPALAFGIDSSPEPALQPAQALGGTWPSGPGQVVIDAGTADQEGYRGRRHDRRRRQGAGPAVHDLRHREVRLRRLDRQRHVRRLRHPDGADALRQGGQARRRSRSPAKAGVTPEQLVDEIQPILPAGTEGADGGQRGEGRDQGRRGLHEVHPLLPARLRRHRALRRRVRHLQHALDHGRPARRASSRRCGRSAPRGGRCSAR